MIALDVAPLPSAVVARRVGRGRAPCWLASPGEADVGLERELLACDPVKVVRGSSLAELEAAWVEAREAWRAGPGTPVGVGFLSYDLGRRLERWRQRRTAASRWPDLEFRFYDAFWVRRATGEAQIWGTSPQAAARLRARIEHADIAVDAPPAARLGPLAPVEPPAHHLEAIRRVLGYIRAGDVYQVNLARRLQAQCEGAGPPGLELFARLQAEAPAPHAIWLGDAARGAALVGNSPERFLRVTTDGAIETRPIKGTRARSSDHDAAAIAELRADPKDRAEHVMIVDLERNDLGRIARTGTVEVVDLARVVSLPTVHHLVTTVRGRLRSGVGLAEILRATFPGGSITGAPKIRAMEIIDELEPEARGPYTGATGWLGATGDLDLAVAIRTAMLEANALTLWVGGGIVADSDPEAELEETVAKAQAFERLVNV